MPKRKPPPRRAKTKRWREERLAPPPYLDPTWPGPPGDLGYDSPEDPSLAWILLAVIIIVALLVI